MRIGVPHTRPDPLKKNSKVEVPEIEPMSSWLKVRQVDQSDNKTILIYIKYMSRKDQILRVVGLSEVRWPGKGKILSENYTMLRLKKLECYTDRLIFMKIGAKPIDIVIVHVNANSGS